MSQQSNGNSILLQGRIIWTLGNNMFEGKQKTNMQTRQVMLDNDGKPVIEYGFGLAVPKIDPRTGQNTAEYVKAYQALHGEALTLFPSGQLPPGFALKYKDGDTAVDDKGVSYSAREGYAGHIVIACTTRIPIKYFRFEGGQNILVNDGIKCGDYVNVQLNIKAHPAIGTSKAGLYVNPSAVQLIQAGKAIINAPSGDQVFGNVVPSYVGQVEAHVAPTMPSMAAPQAPTMPAQPQAPAAPQYAPQAAPAMPPQGHVAPAAPHYGVLPPTMQPAPHAPAAPVMPAMPSQPYPMPQ
jgi:hypothetical protein